MILNDFL